LEEGRRRDPGNDQPTLSIHTTKVSQKKSEEKKERDLRHVPGTRPLGALGLDVGRRCAHEGAHRHARVSRLQVEEATGTALLMRVSLLLCMDARERETYDDGGGGGTPVAAVAVVAAAEAGEEGAESGRERHFLCRLEKRKKGREEKVII
jgi:hypothetical protein